MNLPRRSLSRIALHYEGEGVESAKRIGVVAAIFSGVLGDWHCFGAEFREPLDLGVVSDGSQPGAGVMTDPLEVSRA